MNDMNPATLVSPDKDYVTAESLDEQARQIIERARRFPLSDEDAQFLLAMVGL